MAVRLLIAMSVLLCCTAASSRGAVSDVVNTDFGEGLMIDPYGKMNPGLWAVVSELSIDDIKLDIENNIKLAIDSNDSSLRKQLSRHLLRINAISQKDGEGRYVFGNVLKASLGDDFVRFIAWLTSLYLKKINMSGILFYQGHTATSPLKLDDIIFKSPDGDVSVDDALLYLFHSPDGDVSVENALLYLFHTYVSRPELKFDAEFMLKPSEVLMMSFLHDILDDLTLHQFFKELSHRITVPGASMEDMKMMGFSKDRDSGVPFDNDKYLEDIRSSMVKSLGIMPFDDQNKYDDASDGVVARKVTN